MSIYPTRQAQRLPYSIPVWTTVQWYPERKEIVFPGANPHGAFPELHGFGDVPLDATVCASFPDTAIPSRVKADIPNAPLRFMPLYNTLLWSYAFRDSAFARGIAAHQGVAFGWVLIDSLVAQYKANLFANTFTPIAIWLWAPDAARFPNTPTDFHSAANYWRRTWPRERYPLCTDRLFSTASRTIARVQALYSYWSRADLRD